MNDQHPAEGDWAEWWPNGRQRWIKQALSIEQLVEAAFLAGWDTRNGQLSRLAVSIEGEREARAEQFTAPTPPLGLPRRAPVMPQRDVREAMMARMGIPPSGPAPGRNWMAEMAARADGGPPPVMNLDDYVNSQHFERPQAEPGPDLATLARIKERIEAITPAPGNPDPDETRDLPVVADDIDPREATFERLRAAWTEEYGPEGQKEDSKWVS